MRTQVVVSTDPIVPVDFSLSNSWDITLALDDFQGLVISGAPAGQQSDLYLMLRAPGDNQAGPVFNEDVTLVSGTAPLISAGGAELYHLTTLDGTTWFETPTAGNDASGGGGIPTLLLNFAGGDNALTPIWGLPADWAEGTGGLGAQLTIGDGQVIPSGILLDVEGGPLPDGFTFPAIIFVEGSTIYDIISINPFGGSNSGGILSWESEGTDVPVIATRIRTLGGIRIDTAKDGIYLTTQAADTGGISLTDQGSAGATLQSSGTGPAALVDSTAGGVGANIISEAGAITLIAGTNIVLSSGVPTSDPHVLGALYTTAGVVHVSAG
jgi:hypothetical protein